MDPSRVNEFGLSLIDVNESSEKGKEESSEGTAEATDEKGPEEKKND